MKSWAIFMFVAVYLAYADANCEPGYTLAGTYCYKFDASRKGDFDTQRRRCESEGSQMIEYPNYQSFDDLSAHVRTQYGKALPIFWIGLKATGGSDHSYANSYHWLSDKFEQNTKVQPGLLQWWKNYPLRPKNWLCVWTQKGALRNQPCRRTNGILACQYDPLIGLIRKQDFRTNANRVNNLASERRERLKALEDQRNSGRIVGSGTGTNGNTINSNKGSGFGFSSNNQQGSFQNQYSGGQYANRGNGQPGNGRNGQYANGVNGQYGNGRNRQYGNGKNGQYENGRNNQYGKEISGQYGNGGKDQYGNGGNGQYGIAGNGQNLNGQYGNGKSGGNSQYSNGKNDQTKNSQTSNGGGQQENSDNLKGSTQDTNAKSAGGSTMKNFEINVDAKKGEPSTSSEESGASEVEGNMNNGGGFKNEAECIEDDKK